MSSIPWPIQYLQATCPLAHPKPTGHPRPTEFPSLGPPHTHELPVSQPKSYGTDLY
ncbi:hypothetical protein PAXRUDRAFT_22511 [Paxillus rubicundulus Ve08.2h10]|uniref:Unplaced genomic scaffold scaffold_6524, whole genome shotgun sequence n=1 Tax=Paxillus rubicundulus Ve08.2h10 TaxID=930991 RepID=A0A0D0BK18_9AGAM|nr:hypothetical protein PAXRUDRAFT_22511 [Paxillus rubicundulus Ve08.2h10]